MTLKPIPLTVGNAATLGEWQIRLTQYIEQNNKTLIANAITTLYSQDAGFAQLVDEALHSNGAFTQEHLTQWAKHNIVKAAQLQQMLKTLPQTLSALQLGIECMKATVDQTLLTDVEKEQFNTDAYWNGVQFETVQQYCNTILDMS